MKFKLSRSPSFGKSYLNPWWGVMKLLPAYLHGSFPAESHTKLLSSYPFWVTPFAQTRLVVWSSQKNKHREGWKFDFMSLKNLLKQLHNSEKNTPGQEHELLSLTWNCSYGHDLARPDFLLGNRRCSSSCPLFTVVTQNVIHWVSALFTATWAAQSRQEHWPSASETIHTACTWE